MWVVTIHKCDGSTAEAMDVRWSFGGFRTESDAANFAETMYASLSTLERHSEWYAQHFEMPEIQKIDFPMGTPEQVADLVKRDGEVPKGAVAIDTLELARQLIEDDGPKMLAPPPDQDEINAAIASITGDS